MKKIRIPIVALAALAMLVFVAGCITQEQIDQIQAQIDTSQELADADRDRVSDELAEAHAFAQAGAHNAEEVSALEAELEAIKTTIAGLDKAEVDLQAGADADYGGIVSRHLTFLPIQYREPAVLLATLLGLGERLRRTKRGLNTLAESTVALAKERSDVRDAIDCEAKLLSKTQSPEARAAIDAAQAGRKPLPV